MVALLRLEKKTIKTAENKPMSDILNRMRRYLIKSISILYIYFLVMLIQTLEFNGSKAMKIIENGSKAATYKGQIISNGLFSILGFFQKTNEQIRFSAVRQKNRIR